MLVGVFFGLFYGKSQSELHRIVRVATHTIHLLYTRTVRIASESCETYSDIVGDHEKE